jgi:AcrR family transcriptional regulator
MSSLSRRVKTELRDALASPRPHAPASAEPVRARANPLKQERSARTLAKLVDAAEALLGERGLEYATVPRIARRARMSVGVVYRRFPDKDAMLRAVYERFFTRSHESVRRALDPERWPDMPLAPMVRMVVGGLVAAYRCQRGLLRALTLYAETHPDAEFRRRADELNAETLRLVTTLFARRRGEIAHPHPQSAIRFGFLVVALSLRGILLRGDDDESHLRPFRVPADRLGEELSILYLGYLGLRATS